MWAWISRKFHPPSSPPSTVGTVPNYMKGPGQRISNCFRLHSRGILGVLLTCAILIPVALLYYFEAKKPIPLIAVEVMWYWLFLFYLMQPIAIPCTSMIPIFLLPMCGVMSTMDTTKCYFNEGVCLFILSSMLLLLLNNSGCDRRIALWLLTWGDACQFASSRLVWKFSTAAYFLSMFCNRLIVTSTLTEYVTQILIDMQAKYGKNKNEAKLDEVRYIVNNAIQTSSSIGSIAIIHSAYATLLFRAIWNEPGLEYPDIFSYLQYSLFAVPVSFVMYLFNACYHMVLVNNCTGKSMSSAAMNDIRANVLKLRATIPKKVTCHEMLTVLFSFIALLVLFLRWNRFQKMGWADYNVKANAPDAPCIRDACVVALFTVAMHVLPKSFNFLQLFQADKKSEVKDFKPESSILWWRFVDKNTNYGYFFVFGAAIALDRAIKVSGLTLILSANIGKDFTSIEWNAAMFLICFLTCILANIMSGVAGVVCFLPLIINMVWTSPAPWQAKLYVPVLGVGVGSSLGFMLPFLYTPAYFCHHTGKVPVRKMVLYSFLSVWGCMGILWFSLCYLAPVLWDPKDQGILPVTEPMSVIQAIFTPPTIGGESSVSPGEVDVSPGEGSGKSVEGP